ITLSSYIEQIRDKLAENIHEMWAMNKIEAGWMYGDQRDDLHKIHPTILALGYYITLDKPPARIRNMDELVDQLAENTHNLWARERIQQGWTYGLNENTHNLWARERIQQGWTYGLNENTHNLWARERIQQGWTYGLNENTHNLWARERIQQGWTYGLNEVDEAIKKANRDTASETVRTLLVYGYNLDPPTGEQHEALLLEASKQKQADFRTYRAEKNYAVSSGKWYFEFEILTAGPMRVSARLYDATPPVGWAHADMPPGMMLGQDENSWAFDGYNFNPVTLWSKIAFSHRFKEEKVYSGSTESFGKQWAVGDVVGVFLDLIDKTISFSLNGELLMDALGGETTFADVQGDNFVPACTLGVGQKARLTYGQDVNTLKYFTTCGLQEGYEPFCVNMNRDVTHWYTKDQPIFENTDEMPDTRIDKARRWVEIKQRQQMLMKEATEAQMPAHIDQIMRSGFTMNDIKGLHYDENQEEMPPSSKMKRLPSRPPRKTSIPRGGQHYNLLPGQTNGMHRSTSEAEMAKYELGTQSLVPDDKKDKRGRSPFKFFRSKRGESGDRGKSRKSKTPDPFSDPEVSPERGTTRRPNPQIKVSQMQTPTQDRKQMTTTTLAASATETVGNEIFDGECLKLINEYFYGVSVNRQSCYMVRADELYNEVMAEATAKGASQGMFIGCSVDTSTGTVAFTCEGKETSRLFKMEPETKLFPAIFVEATSKEILQIELGRSPISLPLSAAVLPTSDKHVIPQFPPRLKVQCLKPHQWARVPNQSLQVHALKLSDIRGWSMLCEDAVSMLALHIPVPVHVRSSAARVLRPTDRSAPGVSRDHHVSVQQYMSGPLRQGFYDLLIALHLESHATTMEVCKNEFVIPLGPELKSLYDEPEMGHSLRSLQTESVRPHLKMTDITESITEISNLYSPHFPLEVVREFVMQALADAVTTNQVHNRDPMAEGAKLQMCYLLQHLNDIQLRHRVEAIIAFAHDFVGDLQGDQLRVEAIIAFAHDFVGDLQGDQLRVEAIIAVNDIQLRHRVEAIIAFAHDFVGDLQGDQLREPARRPVEHMDHEEESWKENCPCGEELIARMSSFHDSLMVHVSLSALQEPLSEYDAVGELIRALEKTYVINAKTKLDVAEMWVGLSQIRALLPVQMSQEEEELMRKRLWKLVNNHTFFQHPDLIRVLRVHENVMAVMMNTLGRRAQAQSDAQPASPQPTEDHASKEKDTSHEMVVACCRFLCYFCRTGRQNQKAMFDHFDFLLENSNILLSRPSLRGSTPLDVAYSSLMENTELALALSNILLSRPSLRGSTPLDVAYSSLMENTELALALREHYLEKIAVYLSRCGLQSNSELVEKGYPDLGWDPVEGERYLDFLRFCVWVNYIDTGAAILNFYCTLVDLLGRCAPESSVIALVRLHRHPGRHPELLLHADYIDTGAAILNFYCTLVDLLGRCAPESSVIALGKNESLRARAILRSLVPLEDLQGVLSLRFTLNNPAAGEERPKSARAILRSLVPLEDLQGVLSLRFTLNNPAAGEERPKSDMPSGLIPGHKQSVGLFLERVYGIETQELFYRLLEEAFLPDLRAATMLDRNDGCESDMALSMNRYIGNSILPLLIKHANFYNEAENYASLLDATLHTREAVSDFLVALTSAMQPSMLLKLLRKLTVDVSRLSEYTTVALRLLTLHYERCAKYYGSTGGQGIYGQSSDEEKRLTMMLFSNIFDSLSKMDYEPELFGKALPCLIAIVVCVAVSDNPQYDPQPINTSSVALNNDLNTIVQKFSEHYHDAWASRKIENSWVYGDSYSDGQKAHPRLKPYNMLNDYEKERYKEPVRESLKALLAIGWSVEHSEVDIPSTNRSSMRRQSKSGGLLHIAIGWSVEHSEVDIPSTNRSSMRRQSKSGGMQNMAERLAENAHDIWAKKKKEELVINGELRFAYSLLEKLIQYIDRATINMKLLKPSTTFSRRPSFKTSTRDIKFFSKVVLPLMEKYFSTHRNYFIAVATATNNVGAASLKEKEMCVAFNNVGAASLKENEMVAALFCKLASLLRSRLAAFGPDVRITVRCLQVLVKGIDAKSLGKYAHLRGTHLKTSTSLGYINGGSCLGAFSSTFPVAFLEPHLNKHNQFSLLNRIADHSLEAQDHPERGGPVRGVREDVLGGAAHHRRGAATPLLIPALLLLKNVLKLIKKNIGNESAPWMTRIATYTQQIIINSSEELLRESFLPLAERVRKRTDNMFHKEESLRGFIKRFHQDKSSSDQLLGESILPLAERVRKRTDNMFHKEESLRGFIKSEDLLRESFLPLAEIVRNRTDNMFHKEESLRGFIKSSTDDTSQVESQIQEDWQLLVRDIYSFYPLLIKYVLIMPTATRRLTAVVDGTQQGGGKKRDKDKEVQASLMVACLKRLLPVGLNLFAGREQELVQHCKDRFLKKMSEQDVSDFAKTQLTLPDKIDPADEMSWQHYLYRCVRYFAKTQLTLPDKIDPADEMSWQHYLYRCVRYFAKTQLTLPYKIDPADEKSWQHYLYGHRAINIFARTYYELWLEEENIGQEVMIEDLTQSFEDAELKKSDVVEEEGKPDPLTQLVTTFCRGAMTERSGALQEDPLYMSYAYIIAKSCGEEEEEGGGEEEEGGGEEQGEDEGKASIHEQEMEKQKLLFHQARLANRGVAEMVLLHISASKGMPSEMVMKTLELGISILRGGNIDIQMGMLNHLKDKKDVGFFTSIAGLMNSCSVLDLDAFERNTKAEGEHHGLLLALLEQGTTTTSSSAPSTTCCACRRASCTSTGITRARYYNVVICTVDCLLRLQESIMDFYWHYSSKELIDPAGKANFFKAIGVASQVFNTLTEVIQGPCTQNQQALAHSRQAVQALLASGLVEGAAEPSERHDHYDAMVDTLVESASNVELILKYFDMFLKLKDLTSSASFQEIDANNDGWVLPKDFKEKMEQQKSYTPEEIEFLLACCETNHDGKLDYVGFRDRFHEPAKEIGFNLAVLLTNLSEHMPNEPRLHCFLAGSTDRRRRLASIWLCCLPTCRNTRLMNPVKLDYVVFWPVPRTGEGDWFQFGCAAYQPYKLNYVAFYNQFREPAKNIGFNLPVLLTNLTGYIYNHSIANIMDYSTRFDPIMGGAKRIERVYFEIKESNIEQWEKPQIKESKRAFFYSIVTEGGDKEKLEAFVNFCEDAIFEMTHASGLMAASEESAGGPKNREASYMYMGDDDDERAGKDPFRRGLQSVKDGIYAAFSSLSPANIKAKIADAQQMPPAELALGFFKMFFYLFYYLGYGVLVVVRYIFGVLLGLMRGPQVEEPPPEPTEEEKIGCSTPQVSTLEGEGGEGSGIGDIIGGSGSGAGSGSGDEVVHIDEDFFYMEHVIKIAAAAHSVVSLAILIGYYHLKVWKAGVTFTDNSFLYSLWYFSFSVMGNFNNFFFAAHLLDVAVGFKTLRTILQSVTHNGKQGVRAGGGIGDELEPPDGDDSEVYRIIFDITFFFFIIVILLAILQGLIIDAFGELRDQLESVKEDMESNCFICGIGKDYFDK
ncbi:Ryanodine receptor 44F, partial [Operophtera brumata]